MRAVLNGIHRAFLTREFFERWSWREGCGRARQDEHLLSAPIVSTPGHQGKVLILDCENETLVLLGPTGHELGCISWNAVIIQLLGAGGNRPTSGVSDEPALSRHVRIHYTPPDGQRREGRASRICKQGVFIETTDPLPVGTILLVGFTLPDHRLMQVEARGRVAWVCPRCDQYDFAPGIGVTFLVPLALPE